MIWKHPLSSIAQHYVLQKDVTGSMILGASSEKQLLESLHVIPMEVPESILQKASEITKKEIYKEHRI